MIYVVKKNVKNDAHDTKNDKSLTYISIINLNSVLFSAEV